MWAERIDAIAEHDAAPPREVRRGGSTARGESRRRWDLEQGTRALGRALSRMPAEALDSAMTCALETLGFGLQAEWATFHPLDPDCRANPHAPGRPLAASHAWSRKARVLDAGMTGVPLCLNGLTDRGRALRAGEAVCVTQPAERALVRGESGKTRAATSRVRAWNPQMILAPCIGPGGLLGVFRVEGVVLDLHPTVVSLDRAKGVADLVAQFLERSRLACELEELRERQAHDERLETIGRIAASVTHDFNNVVTAILGYADLLEMELPEAGPGHTEVNEIRAAATRAADLAEQVLCFGRDRKSGAQRVDLAEVLGRLEGMIGRVVGRDFEVRVAQSDSLPPVELDAGRFERAVLNLASNARDARRMDAAGPGQLEFDLRSVWIDPEEQDHGRESRGSDATGAAMGLSVGRYLCLRVRDDGCGIDPAIQHRIFEPFFTTKGERSGTGLGLATVADVMREAGGAVRVESAPGQGTTFRLYFPVVLPVPSGPSDDWSSSL